MIANSYMKFYTDGKSINWSKLQKVGKEIN